MADGQFDDPDLAGLYDLFHPWEAREDLAFYLPLVLSADAVLDVGCGTGMLLHRARDGGHTGRLCGLDPALAMLDHARERTGIEWVHGDVSGVAQDRAFDLIVMSGHAFQVFLTDDELHSSLAAISNALDDDGRFAFETRNPFARAWEEWTPENAVEASDASGAKVRMTHHVDLPVTGELVRFTTTYSSPAWDRPQMSRSTLRFLDAESLSSFLAGAGLAIEEQFGDWRREPLTDSSSEIITIARRA